MIANADRTKGTRRRWTRIPAPSTKTRARTGTPVPGNMSFTAALADNQVTDGNAGARNKTRPGSSGGSSSTSACSAGTGPNGGGRGVERSGRVIFAACLFVDPAAMGGGALQMVEGGLIGGSRFAGNRATERAGGAVFFYGHGNGLVQECEFERNSAVTEAGAVFVYGRAIFYKNEFAQNAVVNGL